METKEIRAIRAIMKAINNRAKKIGMSPKGFLMLLIATSVLEREIPEILE